MANLARYSKAIAALLGGLAAAGALLPAGAPAWALAAVPIITALAVALAPRNADPLPKPTRYQPPPRFPRGPGGGDPPPPTGR